MSTTSRQISATPEQVWSVLADGWLYPLFVVGASRMRDVDAGWPAVGTRLHHSVGTWPLLIDDTTEVLEVEEHRRLLLVARGWPAGQAHVEITLAPHDSGTEVTIVEQATAGPGAHLVVLTNQGADVGVVAYQMNMLVKKIGEHLSAAPRAHVGPGA